MKPYEWMVKHTPQTEWIKGSGIVVWLSFFAGIFGSGSYLASLYFNSITGSVISWLIIVALKGGLHVGHARNPLRLWRIVLGVRTSWIARGMVFTGLLAFFGAFQIILFRLMPGTAPETTFKVLTGIAAFAVLLYEGFTLNYISGIPFWNSALLPATLMSWGILSGLALVGVMEPSGKGITTALETANRIVLVITALLTVLYFWNAVYAGATSRESVREITRGRLALLFWTGAVTIGMAVPFFILFSAIAPGPEVRGVFLLSGIVGCLSFTYAILGAGLYRPLIPE